MKLKAQQIADAVNGIIISGDPETVIENITTDSRKLKGRDIFVPIIGAKVDGHKFISNTISAGAVASFSSLGFDALIEIGYDPAQNAVIIKVDDTLDALQKLGAFYRSSYVNIPYIGVTGSVGKTTVREMTACALSSKFRVYSTKGNANSQTGVPITVTETDEDAGIGVIEMGISEFGEMSRISKVVQCDMAIVTVIGVSHIANLGSQENIMREKLKICECMKKDGILLLNGDDRLLSGDNIYEYLPHQVRDNNIKVIYYGTGSNAFVRADNISLNDNGQAEYDLYIDSRYITHVELTVQGSHMVLNSLAAISAAYFNGADPEGAAVKLKEFNSLEGRGQMMRINGITVINDAYNAAPQSMMAGLKVLDSIRDSRRRIAVLADMLELGPDEERYHREVGEFIAESTTNISTVMLLGNLSENIADGIRSHLSSSGHDISLKHFDSVDELKEALKNELKNGDAVLFKGSNSMKLGPLVKDLFN